MTSHTYPTAPANLLPLMLNDVPPLCQVTGKVGTFAYMAPEIVQGKRVSEKVDIYSYGVLLWEICTSEVARRGAMRPLRWAPVIRTCACRHAHVHAGICAHVHACGFMHTHVHTCEAGTGISALHVHASGCAPLPLALFARLHRPGMHRQHTRAYAHCWQVCILCTNPAAWGCARIRKL